MSFLLLRPVGVSGGGDPFCRCAGRKEGASAGRSLLQAVLWRGLSGLVRAPLSAAPLPLHGGGEETAVSAAGFPVGFLGDFCAPFEGRFARRGERGANALLAGGMMGSLALSLAGCAARAAAGALPFCPMGERLGEGKGLPGELLAGCARGPGAVSARGKGLSGMDGESAAPVRPRREARRRGEGAWPQLPAGGADGGLPMEKGAAVCYND